MQVELCEIPLSFDAPCAAGASETGDPPGRGGESKRSADKSRGITADKRYIRDAYKKYRPKVKGIRPQEKTNYLF